MKIVIINYGIGNLRSVQKAFKRAGGNAEISADVEKIKNADKLVLPGVGHFKEGMDKLKKSNLIDALNYHVLIEKKPILGICLGMQLMTEYSEEGEIEGLKWVKAESKKFNVSLKVPHIGWNTNHFKNSLLMNGLTNEDEFYFTHSYYVETNKKHDNLLYTDYEKKFVSGFSFGNIHGVQFHPEKSHESGIKLIKNFINS